jgi:hypothetical protein
MVVSASQVPHWTPLMAAALICVPVSQEGEDGDIATTRGGTSSNPQHWATSPGSQIPKGSLVILHHPQLLGSLLQMSNQASLVTRRSKNKVTDLQASSLEMRALVCSLPKPNNNLSNNTRLGNIIGQASKNGLGCQRHRRPKRR